MDLSTKLIFNIQNYVAFNNFEFVGLWVPEVH
jgi:hypothetical protein